MTKRICPNCGRRCHNFNHGLRCWYKPAPPKSLTGSKPAPTVVLPASRLSPTPFEAMVINAIATEPNHIADEWTVRAIVSGLMLARTGRWPHQAAIAAHITRFAWRKTYIQRITSGPLVLTPAGKDFLKRQSGQV